MKPSYIPFRESKLTRLFQPFFCGKGKACMIVNINQHTSTYDETLHVMKFSAIARQVRVYLLSLLFCFFFFVTIGLWNDQVVWIWVWFGFLIYCINSSACGFSLRGFLVVLPIFKLICGNKTTAAVWLFSSTLLIFCVKHRALSDMTDFIPCIWANAGFQFKLLMNYLAWVQLSICCTRWVAHYLDSWW